MNDLQKMRHSCAHLYAYAIRDMYPDVELTIGPPIDNGFYYDVDMEYQITENDLKKIEKKMKFLQKQTLRFERYEMPVDEAIKKMKNEGWEYKVEMAEDLKKKGEKVISFYKNVDKNGELKFEDMCEGPHIEDMKNVGPFKLAKVAGAYWRGDEKNKMLQRVYGYCFETQIELDDYMAMLREAEKRDHRKIGKELDLFTFSPLVGNGLPMFLPRGTAIKRELEEFVRSEKEKRGYSFVCIPHIAKAELYHRSGHLGKYDAMMPTMKDQNGDEFVMKAMNCPHHFEIFNSQKHSYKDLPLRLAENTTCYRNERSGELSGLVRVKSLTQDDTHHFVMHEQIASEIEMILGLMKYVYDTFDFREFLVQVSIRDPKNKEGYFGDDALWEKSEAILIDSVKKWGAEYVIEEGEAAFYGPKIDIMVKDALGRMWQLTTVQLDFNQPENFNMRYVGEDGKEHAPAVLHVAILGSVERFFGIIIEHFAGAFPLWLAPEQIRIIPVSEKHMKYAEEVKDRFVEEGFRVEIDTSGESMGKSIRNAEKMKIPRMFVLGDQEMKDKSVSVRNYFSKEQKVMKLDETLDELKNMRDEKTLETLKNIEK